MERQTMLAAIKERMPEKRYIHTIGVMETAIRLAQQYDENPKKLRLRQFSMISLNMRMLPG